MTRDFIREYVEKWKTVLLKPSKFFKKVKREKIYQHSIIFLLISDIIMFIGTLFLSSFLINKTGLGIMLLMVPILLLLSLGMSFVSAGVLHLFVLLFKGKGKYFDTYKAVAYAHGPSVFGWIPVINIISGIWSLIIQIIGISELHKVSRWKALAIVLIPILIILGLVVLFIGLATTSSLTNWSTLPQVVF